MLAFDAGRIVCLQNYMFATVINMPFLVYGVVGTQLVTVPRLRRAGRVKQLPCASGAVHNTQHMQNMRTCPGPVPASAGTSGTPFFCPVLQRASRDYESAAGRAMPKPHGRAMPTTQKHALALDEWRVALRPWTTWRAPRPLNPCRLTAVYLFRMTGLWSC